MGAEEMFDGFATDPYAAEARERWGDTAREAQETFARWSPAEQAGFLAEIDQIHRDLAGCMSAGAGAADPAVRAVVARHHAWMCRTWTPGREAYLCVGRMYVDDERFTANIDRTAPGLAAFLREAIEVWAPEHLAG